MPEDTPNATLVRAGEKPPIPWQKMTPLERFWCRVEVTGGCWNWHGALTECGYGQFRYAGGQLAHRFSYEAHVGPIPEGMDLDHLCRNRRCANPAHLEPVTRKVNTQRGNAPSTISTRTGKCFKGHDLSPENVYVTGEGKRSCRTCRKALERKHNARKSEARKARREAQA